MLLLWPPFSFPSISLTYGSEEGLFFLNSSHVGTWECNLTEEEQGQMERLLKGICWQWCDKYSFAQWLYHIFSHGIKRPDMNQNRIFKKEWKRSYSFVKAYFSFFFFFLRIQTAGFVRMDENVNLKDICHIMTNLCLSCQWWQLEVTPPRCVRTELTDWETDRLMRWSIIRGDQDRCTEDGSVL